MKLLIISLFLCKNIQNQQGSSIIYIHSDHEKDFGNSDFIAFCDEYDISLNFSALYTPQSNGVVERKNRILREMTSTMLIEYCLPKYFWAKVMATFCYILNRVLLQPILLKTLYELYYGITPKINYFSYF